MFDRISNLSGLISARALQNFTFVAVFLAVSVIFNVSGIYAATFVVNSIVDAQDVNPGNGICETVPGNGVCTLRAAITEANALAGDDIITLQKATYTQTLVGTEDSNVSGDYDITSNITINGATRSTTIIEAATTAGTAVERVFHIPRADVTVIFNDVTIRNGRQTNANGGGVYSITGDNVTFNNCIISNNSSGSGGGIAGLYTASIMLNNTLITANTANGIGSDAFGGGIYLVSGRLIATGSTISTNTVSANAANIARGGGIHNAGGTITLTNTVIDSNRALTTGTDNAFGGGISNSSLDFPFSFKGNLNITDSNISNNIAVSIGGGIGFGGGIYNSGSTLNLSGSTVGGNVANDSAGIRTQGFGNFISSSAATATIDRSAIINNIAITGSGGGVVNSSADANATTTINNSTIGGNMAAGSGAGINNINNGGAASILNLNFSTVANNSANTDNTGTDQGGGIANINTGSGTLTVNLKNSIIADNTIGTGGTDPDLAGSFISGGYNHIENAAGSTIFNIMASDISGSDPQLMPLALNGGATPNYKPAATSPVLDTIPNGTNGCGTVPFNVDQRNMFRPTDSDNNGVAACEKGAVEISAPTAAAVSVSGRVMTASGRGLSNALVYLTTQSGETRISRSSAFGYYHFDDVAAGQTVIISVVSKRYQFTPQVVNVTDNLSELNFIGQPSIRYESELERR